MDNYILWAYVVPFVDWLNMNKEVKYYTGSAMLRDTIKKTFYISVLE